MSELKATPGPWSVDPDSPADVEAPTGSVCIVLGGELMDGEFVFNGHAAPQAATDEDERQANAHLIAAAPSLYEACEAAEEFLSDSGFPGSTLDEIRAALALARGESV